MALFGITKSKVISPQQITRFGWESAFASSSITELVSTYFTCVKILSQNVGQLTPYVADKTGKRIDHPLNSILGVSPNKYQNRNKFASQNEYNRASKGNSLVWIERTTTGHPKALHPIPESAILGAVASETGSLYYRIDFDKMSLCPKRGTENISVDEILHFCFASTDAVFSESPATVLESYTSVLGLAGTMISSFLKNNATSAMAVETMLDKAALVKEVNSATADFTEKYVGVQNAGKPIQLPPNTKLVAINQKFSDAQLVETQQFAITQIGNLFGIPSFMLTPQNSALSIEQQTLQFKAMTIAPVLEIYVAEYESKLLTAQEQNKGLKIMYNVEKLVETDYTTKVNMTALQVAKGLMTPNEGAFKLGNEPIDGEYGDLHYIQSQNNPIEQYNIWGAKNIATEPTEPTKTEDDDTNK